MELIPSIAVAARIFGILVGLPLGESLQVTPRLFIAMLWGAALVPEHGWFLGSSPVRCVGEFLIGLLLAMPLRFLIESGAMLGELLDTARGQTIASIADPLNGQQVSDLTTIVRVGVTTFAVHLGAFDQLLSLAKGSYVILPYDVSSLSAEGLMNLMSGGVAVIEASIRLSSTWLVGYLLCDLVCALLSKVIQGLSFSSTGALVKLVLTVALIFNLLRDTSGWEDVVRNAVFPHAIPSHNSEKTGGESGR